MNSLRVARAAFKTAPALRIAKRGYAEVANDKIRLSLALPHQVRQNDWVESKRQEIGKREACLIQKHWMLREGQ